MIQGDLVNGSVGVVQEFCTIDEAKKRRIYPFDALDREAIQRVEERIPNMCRDPSTASEAASVAAWEVSFM